MENTKKRLFFILLIIAGVKLFLVSNMAVPANGALRHDDTLFVRLAMNILSGNWLGPYDENTLIKGAFYPLFIAVNFLLGLPLLLTQQLFFIFAGLVFLHIVSQFTKSTIVLAAVFAFYLFLPLLTEIKLTHVIRDNIYVSETVLLFSSMFGLILFRNYKWAVFIGISLSILWFTREEGLWVVPSLAAAYFVILSQVRNSGGPAILKTLPILALPIVILMAFSMIIAHLNETHYGLYEVNELKQKSFLRAYGALTRVKPREWKPRAPFQFSTLEEISKNSPAFAPVGDRLKKLKPLWPLKADQDEIPGQYFLWMLREAAAREGYHKSALSASQFYEHLAGEVNDLCSKKVLDCGPASESLAPPFRAEYIYSFPQTFYQLAAATVTIASLPVVSDTELSTGGEQWLNLFQTVTGNRLNPSEAQLKVNYSVSGWAFKKNSPPLEIKLKSANEKPCPYQITTFGRTEGADVVSVFKDTSAKWSRFRVDTEYGQFCSIGFYDVSSALVAEIPLDMPSVNIQQHIHIYDDSVKMYIDNAASGFAYEKSEAVISFIPRLKNKLLDYISASYKAIFPYLCLAALLCFAIRLFKFREYTALFWFNTIAVVGITSRLTFISILHVMSFPSFYTRIFAPATLLLCLFIPLSLMDILTKRHRIDDTDGTSDG